MPKNDQELNEAVREVLKRAAIDPEFRQLAARNSSAAFEKIGKKDLAGTTPIVFLDNHGNPNRTIVLPDPISNASLSDEALEQVAGGSCEVTSCGTSKVAGQ